MARMHKRGEFARATLVSSLMKENAVSNSNVDQLVKTIAQASDLPLDGSRTAAISPILGVWLKDANALSAKMSAPEFAHVTPITGILQTVNHGEVPHGE
ncbi:hypothetical protein BTO02_19560 [Paraburkholderia sp. SOS3]|jgi:hypothetical protein|nr:hypothetical protein BTO02_19560 [Paraburkholderia sp. SOS3]